MIVSDNVAIIPVARILNNSNLYIGVILTYTIKIMLSAVASQSLSIASRARPHNHFLGVSRYNVAVHRLLLLLSLHEPLSLIGLVVSRA